MEIVHPLTMALSRIAGTVVSTPHSHPRILVHDFKYKVGEVRDQTFT